MENAIFEYTINCWDQEILLQYLLYFTPNTTGLTSSSLWSLTLMLACFLPCHRNPLLNPPGQFSNYSKFLYVIAKSLTVAIAFYLLHIVFLKTFFRYLWDLLRFMQIFNAPRLLKLGRSGTCLGSLYSENKHC